MRPCQTDNTNPVRPPMFSLLFFFSGYDPIFFAIFFFFCTPRLGTIDIFACVNSLSGEEREKERESPLFYTRNNPLAFFRYVPLYFPCVFKAKKLPKIFNGKLLKIS